MPDAETDYLEPTGDPETFGAVVRADSLQRKERRHRILELRRKGFTHSAISELLAKGEDGKPPFEITPSGVGSAISAYLKELAEADGETVDELRVLENERLDNMFRRLELDAVSKNPRTKVAAIRAQLKVMERKAKLNGLDAPTKVEGKINVNHTAIADPKLVQAAEQEWREKYGDAIELPAGDVEELPDG